MLRPSIKSRRAALPRGGHARVFAGRLLAFRADRRGVALIEFALVVPILLVMLLVGAELVNAIENRRKVAQLARTLADLTSLGDTTNPVSTATMNNIYDSAAAVLAPYGASEVQMKVTAMGVPLVGVTTVPVVCSGSARKATARQRGIATGISVPPQYQFNGSRWIFVEVSMPYKPILGAGPLAFFPTFSAAFQWDDTATWAIRGGTTIVPNTQLEVILPGGSACPATSAI